MINKSLISIGNSGEYLVAGELERRGFTAAVPMSNAPDFDILAINRETRKQIAIQVKTVNDSKNKWTLSKRNENISGENIFYVFVKLNGVDTPEYFIVPSKTVADEITNGHKRWLEEPGKSGNKHNDNSIRKFEISTEEKQLRYRDAWELLK